MVLVAVTKERGETGSPRWFVSGTGGFRCTGARETGSPGLKYPAPEDQVYTGARGNRFT